MCFFFTQQYIIEMMRMFVVEINSKREEEGHNIIIMNKKRSA